MFADEETLGYDSTMHHGEDSSIVAITVVGKEYIVIDKIFLSDTLRGRVMQCWHVQRNGVAYIIKELWIHNGCTTSKINTLGELAGL